MRGFVEKSWLPSIITHNRVKLQRWLRGNENKIIVHEEAGVRSLYFSTGKVQSSMRPSDPFELELGYTRTMMGFLLFIDEPKNILIVGLGGGSLSKYCYRQFSQARITTLEINREVIGLRDCFLVPHDDERFQVVHADAADYLERNDIQADIILLDGFAADGLPEGLNSESFYGNCWRALSPHGVLVANFVGNNCQVEVYVDRLKAVFENQVWISTVFERANLIAFAVNDRDYSPSWPLLFMKAKLLEARYRLNLAQVLMNMHRSKGMAKLPR